MRKVVVKLGSSVIAPKGKLKAPLINGIVKDVLKVEAEGFKVIMVSSGAIACGLDILGHIKRPRDIHSLMAISSLGQIVLMDIFNAEFKKYKRKCAQILLTWEDFDIRKRFMNVRKTIEALLQMNITPVINENDAVSHEEIRFGDNDSLSARVAVLVGAEELIMLSDVEGLLDDQGKVVKRVERLDKRTVSLARKEDKTHTSGGMITKLQAAEVAAASGIRTVIASGREKEIIWRIINKHETGTAFLPSQRKEKARKKWIASKKVKGRIYIDAGAKEALLNKGKSLLSVGITDVEGAFKSGDAVLVVDEDGEVLGCGLTNYAFEELKGLGQKRLEKEVIHRDNLTPLENRVF